MIGFPHGKINLGLSVVSKRTDGFHNLETVFYPLHLRDIVEIIPGPSPSLILSGLPLAGNPNDNLVMQAFNLLKEHYPVGPLEIHLHKSIPSGGGLGGGSSDAACMMKLLNGFFKLEIPDIKMASFALKLGSDCPFFLQSSPCYARGRGEILEPIVLDLSGYSILLVYPEVQISTAWAFSQIHPEPATVDIRELVSDPVEDWKNQLRNDFEIPVFRQYPQLQKIKIQLYARGALYASMTGSGSSLYGIFRKGQIPAAVIDPSFRQTIIP